MLYWEGSQGLQHFESLCFLLLSHEPQGAFVKEKESNKKEAGRDQLDGHRDAPTSCIARVHILSDTIIYPEANKGSQLVRDLKQASKDTTDGRNRKLSDVTGDRRGNKATAKACQSTAGI